MKRELLLSDPAAVSTTQPSAPASLSLPVSIFNLISFSHLQLFSSVSYSGEITSISATLKNNKQNQPLNQKRSNEALVKKF